VSVHERAGAKVAKEIMFFTGGIKHGQTFSAPQAGPFHTDKLAIMLTSEQSYVRSISILFNGVGFQDDLDQ
jgi:hypothetical protein